MEDINTLYTNYTLNEIILSIYMLETVTLNNKSSKYIFTFAIAYAYKYVN